MLLSTSWIPVEEFECFGTKMSFMASLQLTSQERTRRGTGLAEEHINFMYILGLLTKPLQSERVVLEHYQTLFKLASFNTQNSRYWMDQNIWLQPATV